MTNFGHDSYQLKYGENYNAVWLCLCVYILIENEYMQVYTYIYTHIVDQYAYSYLQTLRGHGDYLLRQVNDVGVGIHWGVEQSIADRASKRLRL